MVFAVPAGQLAAVTVPFTTVAELGATPLLIFWIRKAM